MTCPMKTCLRCWSVWSTGYLKQWRNNMSEDDSWSQYILDRCNTLFKTDSFEDDRVLSFVIQQILRDDKRLYIELDIDGYTVVISDTENTKWHLCIYVSDSKEKCLDWLDKNNLRGQLNDVSLMGE